jgi:hypothetical protein
MDNAAWTMPQQANGRTPEIASARVLLPAIVPMVNLVGKVQPADQERLLYHSNKSTSSGGNCSTGTLNRFRVSSHSNTTS